MYNFVKDIQFCVDNSLVVMSFIYSINMEGKGFDDKVIGVVKDNKEFHCQVFVRKDKEITSLSERVENIYITT